MKITSFGNDILAFTSDCTIDFKLKEGQKDITDKQRYYLKKNFGIERVVNIHQVHGDVVNYVDHLDSEFEEADALVTDKIGIPIVIRTADCVPILCYEPSSRVIAVIHAGWQSTHKRIVQKTLEFICDKWEVSLKDMNVYIGPCIRKESFEVDDSFKEYFPNHYEMINGQCYVDVVQANRDQLLDQGVCDVNIIDCGEDTFLSQDMFSFRREGERSGRMVHGMVILV